MKGNLLCEICQTMGLSLIFTLPGMEFRNSPITSLDSVLILEKMDHRKALRASSIKLTQEIILPYATDHHWKMQ